MIKIIYCILSIVLVTNQLISQHITAGETACNYHLVNASFAWPSYNTYGEYKIDIENDGIFDIGFRSFCKTPSSQIEDWAKVESLDTVSFAVGNNVPASCSFCCPFTKMKELIFGESIDNSLFWWRQTSTSFLPDTASYLSFSYNMGGAAPYSCNGANLPSYLAFRKIVPNDTIFGWILYDVKYYHQPSVVSYAFKYASDTLPPIFSSITSSTNTICKFDSITLAATPLGGTFTGQYVSSNSFQPDSAGNFTVNYLLNNGSNCVTTSTIGIHVDECAELKELDYSEFKCNIYPNPTTGNFVIKGMLNEPITICNELGQIVETVELKKENGYEVKLYAYDSGIYFIGNKLYRQKLVVIH
jgi:hypothetical protein